MGHLKKSHRIGIYSILISRVGLWDSGTPRMKGHRTGIYNILITSVGLWDSGTPPKERTWDGNI